MSPEGIQFTQEEIDNFLAECGKKPDFSQSQFRSVLRKEPEELSYKDIRILISKMGMLSDNERYKYRYILIEENLTEDEKLKYERIYPERTGGGKFPRYFPKKVNVEKVYEEHFLAGRGGD